MNATPFSATGITKLRQFVNQQIYQEMFMINTELLIKLLNADKDELKKFNLDQLRVLLGVFRYFVRMLEREVNNRCTKQSLSG